MLKEKANYEFISKVFGKSIKVIKEIEKFMKVIYLFFDSVKKIIELYF